MSASQDLYDILSIPSHATPQELRRAWQRESKKWHPDRHASATNKQLAEKHYQQVNRAYEILSNPKSRTAYDRERSHAIATRPPEPPPPTRLDGPAPPYEATVNAGTKPPGNRHLPHRYTPGKKALTFDGLAYIRLDEAANRVGQPVERLEMYVKDGELFAVEFDNYYWVTEASLVPIRTRHKNQRGVVPLTASGAGALQSRQKSLPVWAPSERAWPPPRPMPLPKARPSATLDHKYDSPKTDANARALLGAAPTVFLAIIGMLMYAFLANAPNTLIGLSKLAIAVKGMVGG